MVYLRAGYPLHLAGPSGTGKTTMAFHLAALWGRSVTLIHGNDEFSVSDLIGTNDAGYRRSEEYAGTHKTQDALADRMITIRLNPPDRNTEIEIVKAKAGIDEFEAGHIVDIIRELRGSGENKTRPTLRAGIAIGKILGMVDGSARFGDRFFHGVCYDVVSTESAKVLHDGQSIFHQLVDSVIKQVCPPVGAKPRDEGARAQVQAKVKAVNAAFATKLNTFRS